MLQISTNIFNPHTRFVLNAKLLYSQTSGGLYIEEFDEYSLKTVLNEHQIQVTLAIILGCVGFVLLIISLFDLKTLHTDASHYFKLQNTSVCFWFTSQIC
mmetsp:Transcript_28455/g.27429  ORF Transcript_28455/g.27429 Transcript_28455/m.27429 type:complete len:100 (-) Transcript_28455:612-911(-)